MKYMHGHVNVVVVGKWWATGGIPPSLLRSTPFLSDDQESFRIRFWARIQRR